MRSPVLSKGMGRYRVGVGKSEEGLGGDGEGRGGVELRREPSD